MPVTAPEDFGDALLDLQAALPSWWQTRNPGSVLYGLLVSMADAANRLAGVWWQTLQDQSITTASREGLLANFAFAWGLQAEEDALGEDGLRAYIEARAQEDGSVQSLENTLLAILKANPVNQQTGTRVQFPNVSEGSEAERGIQFPSNGEGIQLWQLAPGETLGEGLYFPANGEGLQFPGGAEAAAAESTDADTGQTAPGAPSAGLRFATNEYVEILPNTPEPHHLEVRVLNWLAFDRPAFQRAVERFTPADCYPAVIREVPVI